MSCRIASVWALAFSTLAGPQVQAQVPFPKDLIPTRTALARMGLERLWMAVVPLAGTERLLQISRSQDLFFAQSDQAVLHAHDAQTGQLRWSVELGPRAPYARPVAANSFAVFAVNANSLSVLDRRTGRTIWKYNLGTIPTSGVACDEERVMVGLATGKIVAFSLKEKRPQGPDVIRTKPVEAWNWQTEGPIMTLPLPANRVVAFGSSDGRVYVTFADERTPLYRIVTGGPIGDGLGAFGTRTLLIPSSDNNLYAVDLLTSNVLWTFPSGAPIEQAPLIADHDILVINRRGDLSLLDPMTGSVRWTTPTQGGRLTSVSGTKIYLRSYDNDLFMIERSTGKMLADPAATFQRAGLNFRDYSLSFLNRLDDRIYFGTDSGMIICLREIGQVQPRLLRDPQALPFGSVPPEGIKQTQPAAPAAASEPGALPRE
jgi:outer membrane protein assembly factor BamB